MGGFERADEAVATKGGQVESRVIVLGSGEIHACEGKEQFLSFETIEQSQLHAVCLRSHGVENDTQFRLPSDASPLDGVLRPTPYFAIFTDRRGNEDRVTEGRRIQLVVGSA